MINACYTPPLAGQGGANKKSPLAKQDGFYISTKDELLGFSQVNRILNVVVMNDCFFE